jgi:polysaccharide pyruvyl transferase WcaK-like protein
MKKILYNGYYGFQNTGDDSFIEVCSWGGKNYWNTTNNVFLGNDLPEVLNPSKSIMRPLFKGHNRINTAFLTLNADCFISAGGSTFSKHTKNSLRDIAMFTKNNLNKDLKIGGIGVSIGPFKSIEDEKNVIRYLKGMDFLAVRDNKSFQFVSSINLPYHPIEAFDLAALLPDVYENEVSNLYKIDSKKIIGISVCNYEQYVDGDKLKEEKRNKYVLDLLLSLPKDQNIIYRFFIFNGHPVVGDKVLTDNFVSKLQGRNIEVIPYLNNVKKAWDKVKECDLMISTRLHASIFACYAKVPFFLIEYHEKCSDFLDDVGQHADYRLYDGKTSIVSIQQSIESILFNEEYKQPKFIIETVNKAKRNFTETMTKFSL